MVGEKESDVRYICIRATEKEKMLTDVVRKKVHDEQYNK